MEKKNIIMVGQQPYRINYSNEDHILFVYMGHTLAEIQVFESMLCFTLSAIMKDGQAKSDFEEPMQNNTSKTLGQIANIIKSHLFDEELGELLIKIKDKRNHFVHGFLRKYEWPMLGEQMHIRENKYNQAIEEMELLQKELREVHKKIGKHVAENKLAKIGYGTISNDGNIEIIADNVV